MLKITLTVASLLTLSAYAYGSTENLMTCAKNFGHNVGECTVQTTRLAKAPFWDTINDELTYTVSYDFLCGPGFGPDTLSVGVQAGNAKAIFGFDTVASVTVTGTGDLYIVDFDPSNTFYSQFTHACHIVVKDMPKAVPSSAQVAKWQSELSSSQRDLVDYIKAKEGYDNLLEFYGAFSLIKGLAESFNQKLNNDAMQTLRADSETNNALITSLIKNSAKLSFSGDQIVGLANLKSALSSLDSPAEWKNPDGSPKSLADYLGADDAAVLKAIGERVSPAKKTSYKANHDHFATLAASCEARIGKLKAILGGIK